MSSISLCVCGDLEGYPPRRAQWTGYTGEAVLHFSTLLELDPTYIIHVSFMQSHTCTTWHHSMHEIPRAILPRGAQWTGHPGEAWLRSRALPLSRSCIHHHFALGYEIPRVFAPQVAVDGMPWEASLARASSLELNRTLMSVRTGLSSTPSAGDGAHWRSMAPP